MSLQTKLKLPCNRLAFQDLRSYDNQTGFDDRCGDWHAFFDHGWLLFLADERSAFLQMGAGCNNWLSYGDPGVYHLVDHFIDRPRANASITSSSEFFADHADQLTRSLSPK